MTVMRRKEQYTIMKDNYCPSPSLAPEENSHPPHPDLMVFAQEETLELLQECHRIISKKE